MIIESLSGGWRLAANAIAIGRSAVERRPSGSEAVVFDIDGHPRAVRSTGGLAVGILHYSGEEFEFDDRILTHLQVVISTKLRRKEDFFLSWPVPAERGSGRHAVWIDNGVPIHFFYSGSRHVSINREWLESMIAGAGRASGLLLTDEPSPPS